MTMPTVVLRCDSCLSPAFLYRLYGTADGLCAACFLETHVPETAQQRRNRRAGRPGPRAAGCLRGLHGATRR